MKQAFRIFVCGGKRVKIIKSFTHTYIVEYVKTGKQQEVKKCYVRSWTPKKTQKQNQNQLSLFY